MCVLIISNFLPNKEDGETFAPVLRAAAVPIVDIETCRMLGIYGGRQQPILDTMLCAGILISKCIK